MSKLLYLIPLLLLFSCRAEDDIVNKNPCSDITSFTYAGKVYNTVQIGTQCWLKENLDVGTMIPGVEEMTDNGILEKYCYNDEPDSCVKYGGLYQWWEVMQYTTHEGARGICPIGWHQPTDEEWKVLEGTVDSKYGIGDQTWDDGEGRGYDAGANLKTTSGWYVNGNSPGTDLFGFSGLPGGYRYDEGNFTSIGDYGIWLSSTEKDSYSSWGRYLGYFTAQVYRYQFNKDYGFSVRCLKDD
jgi:uncharacterized protein (TIGR02145 family)